MPPPEESPGVPAAIDDLVRQVTTARDRAGQHRALTRLTRSGSGFATSVFRHLARSGSVGQQLALVYISRLTGPLPAELVRLVIPALADRAVPGPVRLAAAASVLRSVPDDPHSVTPVVDAVTVGLSRGRAVERMYQLQSRVETCSALDTLVAQYESRVRLRCPRCPGRFTRRELIPHLWHRHQLVYQHGQARDPRVLLDAAITTAATAGEADGYDYSYLLASHYFPESDPGLVLQALATRGASDPALIDRLLERATSQCAGLCPVCLSTVPDPIPPLPPAANLSDGCLSADGYRVEVTDSGARRNVRIDLPGTDRIDNQVAGSYREPRHTAVLVALPFFLLGLVVVLLMPPWVIPLPWVGAWLGVLGWVVYIAVRLTRKPLPDRTEQALALAWSGLAPKVGRSPSAVRFLTRLVRSSLGRGDPASRGAVVFELVQHAAVLSDKGPQYQQLLAAVRVLEMLDHGRIGRERVVGLVGVFDPFFRGELGPAYGEAVSELLQESGTLGPGDRERLGILVIGAAFANGLSPQDLVTVARYCPRFSRLILPRQPGHLALLYAVWNGRDSRPWNAVGDAATVFELARETPVAARRILADTPDTLLRVDVGTAGEQELGPVLVTVRGVMVAGFGVADPAAVIQLTRSSSGSRLQYGPHVLVLSARVSARTADQLRKWLKYRAVTLFPEADRVASQGRGGRSAGLLNSLAVTCSLCSTQIVLRTGQVGTPWQGLTGRPGVE